jgi:Flp pilus assembly protein TadD
MKISFDFLKRMVFFLFLLLACATPLRAELNFDFGLTLFGEDEVRFEQSKSADFNYQLLKKYMGERKNNVLVSLHVIVRWFSLIKLSDVPRRDELIELSNKFFVTKNEANVSKPERIKEIFYRGILLANDKEDDPNSQKEQSFEELLLDSEELLAESGDYWIIKGILFHELQKRQNRYFALMKPEEDLKHALTLIPRTAQYYYVIGQAFRFLGSTDTPLFLAIASYEKASSLAPRNLRLQNSLLSIYMGLHEEMQAKGKPEPFWLEEVVYKKIIELSPNNAHALNNLGFLYAEYGVNRKLAQELCQKAVYLAPDNPVFRDSLGWAAFKNGEFHTAELELKKALQLRHEFYEAHYHLATVYYSLAQLVEAAEHYEKAIKLNPNAAEALNNLAYLYAEQNINSKRSLELAEKANVLEPNNASYLDTLGWAHYRVKNYKTALNHLLKANELAPGQGEILLHIGRVYLDCDKFNPALRYLKEAFKVEPNLKDPDNSLYLAIQLHAMHTALSNYHNMLKERVDKDKIHKILINIAQLYQEERLYEKSIEITRICVAFKDGKLPLNKPFLSSYALAYPKEKKAPVKEAKKPEAPVASDGAESALEEEHISRQIPEDAGHALVISFGPELFRYFTPFASFLKAHYDKNITLFIGKLVRLRKNAVIRIESNSTSGLTMLKYLRKYLLAMGASSKSDENSDSFEFRLGKKKYYIKAQDNKVYLSRNGFLKPELSEKLARIFPYNEKSFVEVYCNWENMKESLPRWTTLFLKNPMRPFNVVYTSYSMKGATLNEFSVGTTGRKENNEFFKRYARDLFALKLATKKYDLETVIKLSSEDERVYTYVDYLDFDKWLVTSLNRRYLGLNVFIQEYIQRRLASAVCLMNRAFWAPMGQMCPAGGEISLDKYYGIVSCETHPESPVMPLILNDEQMCSFLRMRLMQVFSEDELAKLFEEPEQLGEVLQKLGFEADCMKNWVFEENEIKCPLHKN